METKFQKLSPRERAAAKQGADKNTHRRDSTASPAGTSATRPRSTSAA